MKEVKMPSHIRTQIVNDVVEEIKNWIYAHETVKYSNEKYSEGIVEGLKQALEIIDKKIYQRQEKMKGC